MNSLALLAGRERPSEDIYGKRSQNVRENVLIHKGRRRVKKAVKKDVPEALNDVVSQKLLFDKKLLPQQVPVIYC